MGVNEVEGEKSRTQPESSGRDVARPPGRTAALTPLSRSWTVVDTKTTLSVERPTRAQASCNRRANDMYLSPRTNASHPARQTLSS